MIVCSKCGYKRPQNAKELGIACPICNEPYSKDQIREFENKLNPARHAVSQIKEQVAAELQNTKKSKIPQPVKDQVIGAIILIALIWSLAKCSGCGDKPEVPTKTAEELAAEDAACRQDLQCWGDKNSISAAMYCDDYVEKFAKYSHEWTDGAFEPKFSHFRWTDQSKGYVTYAGDKIKFQNGFGAWENYIYECDFDPNQKAVLDVRVRAGRL